MQIQEIADSIIQQLIGGLISSLGKPVNGFGMCIKNQAGEIVLANYDLVNGEQKHVGITDNAGTYFYIRYSGVPVARNLAANEAIGACGGGIVTVPAKIVLVANDCKDPQGLMLLLQRLLFTTDLHQKWNYGQKQVILSEKTFNFLPWEIFATETGRDASEYKATSLQIVSIDFDIRFKMNYNNCKEIKFC
jgi:hypothetical protein